MLLLFWAGNEKKILENLQSTASFQFEKKQFQTQEKKDIKNESKCISTILSYFDHRRNYR